MLRNSCLKLFIQALENLQFVSLPLFYLGKFILSFIFKFLSVFNISKQVEYFIKFYLQYEMTWTLDTLFMSSLLLSENHEKYLVLKNERLEKLQFARWNKFLNTDSITEFLILLRPIQKGTNWSFLWSVKDIILYFSFFGSPCKSLFHLVSGYSIYISEDKVRLEQRCVTAVFYTG